MKLKIKELLKNPWILALYINLVSFIVNAITAIFIPEMQSAMSGASIIIGAISAGQIYVHAFREAMPKRLRFSVAIKFAVIQTLLGLLVLFGIGDINPLLMTVYTALLIIFTVVVYFMLGMGSRIQLKAIEKHEK